MTDAAERVILVDAQDRERGWAPKLEAHRSGELHRAFSVFVVSTAGEILLQRRARDKYHSGGLWSNTCCGHPRPGERTEAAARRRLREEMGFECPLEPLFGFVYRAELGGGLVEHEYDHVFLGRYDGRPDPDPAEVEGWRWEPLRTLRRRLEEDSGAYTLWLPLALEGVPDLSPADAGA